MGVMNERGMDMSIMKYIDIHTSVSPFKGTKKVKEDRQD